MDGLTGINIFNLKGIYVSFLLGWWEHCFGCRSYFHTLRIKIHGMLIVVYRTIQVWTEYIHVSHKGHNIWYTCSQVYHVVLMNQLLTFVSWNSQDKWYQIMRLQRHHNLSSCYRRRYLLISTNEKSNLVHVHGSWKT